MPSFANRPSRSSIRVSFAFAIAVAIAWVPSHSLSAGDQSPPQTSRFRVLGAELLEASINDRLKQLRQMETGWEWIDLIERGRIAIAEGDFSGASTTFEASLQWVDRPFERLVSLQLLGRSLLHSAQTMRVSNEAEQAARGRALREAGERLNEAQQSAPLSRDIAAARVAAWSQAGDELETLAAEHQLRVIDPSMEGTARMEPMTVAIVCYAVFKAGQLVLKYYDFGGHLKPEHRAAMLGAMDLAVSTSLVGLPFGAQAADCGIEIVEGVFLD